MHNPDQKWGKVARFLVCIPLPVGKIFVEISDQGIGIPEEEIPNLFQPFYHPQNGSRRAYAGTGLGLYASKKIMDAHGGKINLQSEPRKGTTFTLTFPRAIN